MIAFTTKGKIKKASDVLYKIDGENWREIEVDSDYGVLPLKVEEKRVIIIGDSFEFGVTLSSIDHNGRFYPVLIIRSMEKLDLTHNLFGQPEWEHSQNNSHTSPF